MNIQTTKKGRRYIVSATQNEYTFTSTGYIKSIAFKRAVAGIWKQLNAI